MPEALRVGVFSEVGRPGSGSRHFSGVSNFLSYNIRYCKRRSLEMDLHSYADDDRIDEDGSVQLFGWRPRVPVRVDPTIPQDLRHVVPDQRILRAAAARCYDVINVIAPGTMGMQGIWVARRLGIPVVAMYTTSIAEYAGKRAAEVLGSLEAVKAPTVSATEAIGWWVMRRFYSQRNGIEAVLAPTRRTLEAIGPRLDAPLSILGRGVDTELFRPAEGADPVGGDARDRVARNRETRDRNVRAPDAGPLILYSGRLHRGDKGLDRFIEILDAIPEARLLLVGDGPHREGLEDDLGHRAEFTGKLAGEELAAAYRRCDFFVFPSKHDTFGQVVMEAMASGLPVVVTNRGGPQELVDDGLTGFVADEESFVDRVRELAAAPDLRRKMGRRAREAAEARSWTRIFDELMGHYRRLAASREESE